MELWRVRKDGREIRCTTRSVIAAAGTWDEWRLVELRLDHNGEVFQTEGHRDPLKAKQRSHELRISLEAEGWSVASEGAVH